MANDQFVLSPATVDDVPGMADVYLTAFGSDAFSSFAFPRDKISDQEMKRWLTERFKKTITEKREVSFFSRYFLDFFFLMHHLNRWNISQVCIRDCHLKVLYKYSVWIDL